MFCKKKTIVLIVSFLVVIATAGCKSDDTNTNPKDNSSNTPLTLKVMRPDHPNQPLEKDSPALKEIFNKTGVKIDLDAVPSSNYDDRKNIALGTNNIPDIIRVTQTDLNNHASTGIFLDISEYLEYAPNLQKIIEENPEINRLQVDGNLYGFPILGKWKVDAGPVPMMRVDLLEELNLEHPKNYEDLYGVLKAIREAYPNTYPQTNRNGTPHLLSTIAFPLGSGDGIYYDPDIDGGKYVYGPAREEFKGVVAYLHRLYKDKLLDPDYAVNNAQMWQEKLSSGKSAFFFDNNTFAVNFNRALGEIDKNAKFDLIPLMENSYGQKRAYKFHRDWLTESFAVSSKVENPIEVIKFMDWMYSDEGVDVTNFGVLDEHYTIENGEYVISEDLLKKHASHTDPYRSMQGELGTGLLSFATYIDERPMAAMSPPELLEWKEQIISEDGYFARPIDPPFTDDEREKLTDLLTKVNTLRDQEVDKFIMGTRSLDEYDDFINQLRDQGATEIEDIYNSALKRIEQD